MHYYDKGKRVKENYGDLIIYSDWKLIDDSTLLSAFYNYPIRILTRDTLCFLNDKDTVILFKTLNGVGSHYWKKPVQSEGSAAKASVCNVH
ncbi:hypothetical protein CNR22_02185 [Sphingobacteriaceae bacterium]|nr:hypothetical protein CNR22_02185 [Sphingobacteriaceae bacterium]